MMNRVETISDSSPSNHNINREALKSLPKWKVDYNQSRLFLDRLEQVFYAANLPESEYTKQLLLAVTDVSEANYIKEYIIDTSTPWQQARIIFQNHFDVFNINDKNEYEYERCRKSPRESAQHYSDRYLILCSALAIKDNDHRAINHFIHGLDDKLKEEYKKTINVAKLVGSNAELTSLKRVIELVISLELAHASSSSYIVNPYSSVSTTIVKPSPTSSPFRSNKPMCRYHLSSTTHTTEQCSLNPANRSIPSTPVK